MRSIPIQNVKSTIFRECCPYMVSVVKGEGETLWLKINYLFQNEQTNTPNPYDIIISYYMV